MLYLSTSWSNDIKMCPSNNPCHEVRPWIWSLSLQSPAGSQLPQIGVNAEVSWGLSSKHLIDCHTLTVQIVITGLLQANFKDLNLLRKSRFIKGNLLDELFLIKPHRSDHINELIQPFNFLMVLCVKFIWIIWMGGNLWRIFIFRREIWPSKEIARIFHLSISTWMHSKCRRKFDFYICSKEGVTFMSSYIKPSGNHLKGKKGSVWAICFNPPKDCPWFIEIN